MSQALWIIDDALTGLQSLPDESVDLVLTSPPFLALRSYLPEDHPSKHLEMGSEATPGEFVDALVRVVEECRRVLAPHGSIGIELGDTYGGSGGAGGDYDAEGLRTGQPRFGGSASRKRTRPVSVNTENEDAAPPNRLRTRRQLAGWPLDKSLSLIPQTVWWTLVYGRNPHTGRETEPWRLRNIVRWCRPNPPVGALGDKYRPATSELAIFAKDSKRFFDLDAVREPYSPNSHDRTAKGVDSRPNTLKTSPDGNRNTLAIKNNDGAGRPPYDYWEIPTQPYKGAHYATFPKALVDKPIRSMCPQRVCVVCGLPSERIAETTNAIGKSAGRAAWREDPDTNSMMRSGEHDVRVSDTPAAQRVTLGWSDCGHDDWRNGVVLDPFAGTGTTLEVATGHGRDAIGIDLDERNEVLARERVGMFLTTREVD